MKINISIDDRLVEKLDEYVEVNYTNRSAVITSLLVQLFKTEEFRISFAKACSAMDTAVKKGVVSDSEKEEFEALANSLYMSRYK